jgi:DNA-binding NarL/FixJ family response regulator
MAEISCLTDSSAELEQPVEPAPGLSALTRRQHEVLKFLAMGYSYKEIGAALGISPFTVRAHLHAVYVLLGVKSRARAAVVFLQHGRQREIEQTT